MGAEGFVPSDEDLKQVFVYNDHWKAEYGFLLYPLNEPGNKFVPKPGLYGNAQLQSHCIVAKIDIIERKDKEPIRLDKAFIRQLTKYLGKLKFRERNNQSSLVKT